MQDEPTTHWKAEVSYLNTQGRDLDAPLTLRDLQRFNHCENTRNDALCDRLEALCVMVAKLVKRLEVQP